MEFTTPQLVTWLLIGAVIGSLIGMIFRRPKGLTDHLINTGIGLIGALIGGFLFSIFDFGSTLAEYKISLRDLVSAFAGSLVFLGVLWAVRKA